MTHMDVSIRLIWLLRLHPRLRDSSGNFGLFLILIHVLGATGAQPGPVSALRDWSGNFGLFLILIHIQGATGSQPGPVFLLRDSSGTFGLFLILIHVQGATGAKPGPVSPDIIEISKPNYLIHQVLNLARVFILFSSCFRLFLLQLRFQVLLMCADLLIA